MYSDGRPTASRRLNAADAGLVLHYGQGPNDCDARGAREASVVEHEGKYYLFYDGAGPSCWFACLAISTDLKQWRRLGPVLEPGPAGSRDAVAACSPWFIRHKDLWHMFYVGGAELFPGPELLPKLPYLSLSATSRELEGPWIKQPDHIPFEPRPSTYYSDTACSGATIAHDGEFLQFFSAARWEADVLQRTLGLARTRDLDAPWAIEPDPIFPSTEQVENSSIYKDPDGKYYLFTNHVGIDDSGEEYTDAIWVYWSDEPTRWNSADKAIVLDESNTIGAKRCIGMPSVVPVGDRLALLYDAPEPSSTGHMMRSIHLAWLDLPLMPARRSGSGREAPSRW